MAATSDNSGGKAKITLPKKPRPTSVVAASAAKTPVRSNAGGALRGQARAAQVHAMNAARKSTAPAATAAKSPTHGSKVSTESRLKAKGIVKDRGSLYYSRGPKAGQRVDGAKAAPSTAAAKRSAGFNPFGVPAASMLDAFINSKRKR